MVTGLYPSGHRPEAGQSLDPVWQPCTACSSNSYTPDRTGADYRMPAIRHAGRASGTSLWRRRARRTSDSAHPRRLNIRSRTIICYAVTFVWLCPGRDRFLLWRTQTLKG